jgi:hypothetical protein
MHSSFKKELKLHLLSVEVAQEKDVPGAAHLYQVKECIMVFHRDSC